MLWLTSGDIRFPCPHLQALEALRGSVCGSHQLQRDQVVRRSGKSLRHRLHVTTRELAPGLQQLTLTPV